MRIATLQFAPQLGEVEANIRRADQLLKLAPGDVSDSPGIEELRPDLLVLPEMAFSGYNFPSKEAISPYLEVQNEGPSAQWAKRTALRLKCKVCVGYPEVFRENVNTENESESAETYYNSMLVVDETGKLIHNYRKRFLYYTDEYWAATEGEPERSFRSLEFSMSPSENHGHASILSVPTTFGICMDINPYKFEAPFTAWEFANRVLDSESHLVIISTAWLLADATAANKSPARLPDMDTFNYWIRRFWPLIERKIDYNRQLEGFSTATEKHVVLVIANRTGFEDGADTIPDATYAGTSTIVTITQKLKNSTDKGLEASQRDSSADSFEVKIHCWDIKGIREQGICFADTTTEPKMTFITKAQSDSDTNEAA